MADSNAFIACHGGPKHLIELTQSIGNRTVIVKAYRARLCVETGMSGPTGVCGIRSGDIKGVGMRRR